jgi:uncharacterized protein (TIGR02217 family)
MSQAVFPTLAGLTWNVIKAPLWSTKVQRSAGGKELRAAFWSAPIYTWTLTYEMLRQAAAFTEFQTLIGFFNARQGMFDSFLFTDPVDNAVVTQNFGTGDGVKTQFQLVRTYGGNNENVFDTNAVPQIFVNGVLKTVTTDYSISATGLVTFVVAPGAALAVTWTGSYYWRVRFDIDQAEFNNFLSQLWEAKKITFVSVK